MGASHCWATRNRGSARFTHTSPTFQISEETPPLSSLNAGISYDETRPAPRSRRRTGSGRESLNRPVLPGAAVEQAIVQPVAAPLPELDLLRLHAIAAPVRRPRGVVAIARLNRLHRRFEDFS